MAKRKCMHCSSTNFTINTKEFKGSKNNKWTHTYYYCNHCKFYGTHSTKKVEKNNVNPKK
jgi:hypothetical protein